MQEELSGVAGLIGEVEGEVQGGVVDMEEEILEVVEELPWQWVGLQLGQGLGVA